MEQYKKINIRITIFGILLIIFPVSNIFLAGIFGYHYTPLQNFFRGFFVLFSIVTGIGILSLKEWARKLAVIFSGIAVAVSLLAFFMVPETTFRSNSSLIINFWMIVYGSLLLWFFRRNKTKKEFEK